MGRNRVASLLAAGVLAALSAACSSPDNMMTPDGGDGGGNRTRPRKIYVCAQNVGRIDVLDGTTLASITSIPTGDQRAPHNVTVNPAGDRVLATNAHLDGSQPDELLVIDPAQDAIVARVNLEQGATVAHVVVSPDGKTAYVTGWGSNRVYRVDLGTMTRLPDLEMPALDYPHGTRLSADGRILYTANSGMSVSKLDVALGTGVDVPLPGPGLQVAVGTSAVFASVTNPPAVARIDLATSMVTDFRLPAGTPRPGQLVLSPDERTVYVGEEGDSSAPGNHLLAVDAATGSVLASYEVGLGAHGVAISPDGKLAFVTGIFDASVAVVDLEAGMTEPTLGRTGRGPNGIAAWF